MALRALQGPAGGSAPVGGSGTTNTIPRWTGPTTLGDSGLIDDGTQVYTTTRNIGIGTASPTGRLHVVGGTAAASTNGAPVTIVAQSGGTGNTNGGSIVLTPGTQAGTGTVGLVDLSGPTGTGLKLPATPGNADTQTLDAYKENTFTPTIQGGTTAGVGTYTSQVGTFTIIGRCLFFNVEIAWSAHTGTGVVQLAGLPVAAAQLATFGLDSNYAAAGYLRMSAGNTYAQINTINVPATGNYRVSGCYFIV